MQIQVTIQSNHKLSAYRDRKPRTRQEEQNRAEQDWQKKSKAGQTRTKTDQGQTFMPFAPDLMFYRP